MDSHLRGNDRQPDNSAISDYFRERLYIDKNRGREVEMTFWLGAVILCAAALFWLNRLYDLVQSWRRVPKPTGYAPPPASSDAPLISVVIPAHNEEPAIRDCIDSVLTQDYPRFEVIVVDDRSADATLEIARTVCEGHDNCKIMRVHELLPGWTGKCQALHTGVQKAAGDWLAFLDADTRLHPNALSSVYAIAVSRNVSLVTLTPKFVLTNFWEKALQPIFAATCCILFPLGEVNDEKSPTALANGMFYMIRRDAYERIGGHEAVKHLAVEDVGIGKRVKAAGFGILAANGVNLMETKMFDGFRATLDGWTRILSACLDYRMSAIVKYLLMHVLASFPVYCAALFLYAADAYRIWPSAWFILPAFIALLMGVVPFFFLKEMGLPTRYAALLMIGNLFLVWVHAVMLKRVIFGDALEWRGTHYKWFRYEPRKLDP
ncbi:MAG: glycosyltransferase [Desulfomonilaceae bacterium]